MRFRARIHLIAAIVLAAGFALVATPVLSAQPRHAWTHQFGSAGADKATASAVDQKRDVYVAGCASGPLGKAKYLAGGDAFVRKFHPDGHVAWTHVFGTKLGECAMGVAVDRSGHVIVGGYTDGALPGKISRGGRDAFVRKYRPGGHLVWSRQFGTTGDDTVSAVATDSAGHIYVTGTTNRAFPSQTIRGASDVFVRKYRPDGKALWTREFGTASSDYGNGIATDAAGHIYVAGGTRGVFGGQHSRGSLDAFVRKLRPNGKRVWTRQFGTSGSDYATSVVVDAMGRSYAGGTTTGTFPTQTAKGDRDAFLHKSGPDGRGTWTRQFGSAGYDTAEAVDLDPSGRVVVVGRWGPTLASDGYVRKLRPDGSRAWMRRFGSALTTEQSNGVSVDRLGNVYTAGSTDGTLSGQVSAGNDDAFLRKYRL